jgi:hypothetical protein
MNKWVIVLLSLMIIVGAVFSFGHMGASNQAWACGWGTAGGGDFGPQARYTPTPSRSAEGVSQNQAYDIISDHLARLNPSLQVGPGIDAGTHYEFEVLANGKSVDRLAVDKSTGSIRPVN